MTDLHPVLSKLGLTQYYDKFNEEGFETWETVLEITESDLYGSSTIPCSLSAKITLRNALGVKLGHRRVCTHLSSQLLPLRLKLVM